MLLRLIPGHGGDGTVYGITVLNDTGSDAMTVFTTDLLQLGNMQGYTGWHTPTPILDASGNQTVFQTILVQVQLVRNDNTPWGNWIQESAIVKQALAFVPRLSGPAIRGVLYFGTAPGNNVLAVAATKGGMASLL